VTNTGVVGTFGGVNYPSVAAFMVGFEQGVQYYNQTNDVDVKVIGWDSTQNDGLFIGAFCCFDEGNQFAEHLIAEGADIIMPVAGPFPGRGALDAALNYDDIFIIGVDFDWAEALPEYADIILTSVEKRYNVSVVSTIASIEQEEFAGGLSVGTLESGEVGISPFHQLDKLIAISVKADLADITKGIISGEIMTTP
jgi:basic membrane protein A